MCDGSDLLHKPSLGYYQSVPIQGTAPKRHKHLFSENGWIQHQSPAGTLDDPLTKMQTSTLQTPHLEPAISFGFAPILLLKSLPHV